MLKTRSRIINFRVTEDEFEQLKYAALDKGARCLSDYARTAILHGFDGSRNQAPVQGNGEDKLQSLVQRLGTVEQSLTKLESMVSRLSAHEREEMRVGASL